MVRGRIYVVEWMQHTTEGAHARLGNDRTTGFRQHARALTSSIVALCFRYILPPTSTTSVYRMSMTLARRPRSPPRNGRCDAGETEAFSLSFCVAGGGGERTLGDERKLSHSQHSLQVQNTEFEQPSWRP